MTRLACLRRAAPVAAFSALTALAACNLDDLSGPRQQVGDPLLDMTLGPAADAAFPGGSFCLGNVDTTRDASGAVRSVSCRGSRDTLTLMLANLPPLPENTSYQILLVDSARGALRPVSGRLISTTRTTRPVTRDSSVIETRADTATNVGAVDSVERNQSYVFRVTTADLGAADSIANYSHVVLAATPTPIQAGQLEAQQRRGFLYARFRTALGNPGTADDAFATTGNFTFGSFAIDAARRVPFVQSGSADAAFRGTEIRVNFRQLVRPPEGFRYAGWLLDERTGRQVRLGGLLTPVPENRALEDADVGTGSFLTDIGIAQAQLRADAAALGINFDDFTRFALVLEPKGGTAPTLASAASVMVGLVPPSVALRHPAAGRLFGQVTSQSNAPVAQTVLFLTPVGQNTPLLAANADATGSFRFRTVHVGQYQLHAIPPGGTTSVWDSLITIGTHREPASPGSRDSVTVGDSVFVNVRIP